MARPVKRRWLIVSFLAGALVSFLVVGFVAAGLFLFWRSPDPPTPEAQTALSQWLSVGCTVNEGDDHDDALRNFSGELEAPLIELFERGPAASEIQRVENDARRQIERTQALARSGYAVELAPSATGARMVSRGYSTGLPRNDMEALRAASVDDFVKRASQEFVDSQRTAALVGLGITGGSRGRQLLEQIAADPGSPFNDVARLARFGESSARDSSSRQN